MQSNSNLRVDIYPDLTSSYMNTVNNLTQILRMAIVIMPTGLCRIFVGRRLESRWAGGLHFACTHLSILSIIRRVVASWAAFVEVRDIGSCGVIGYLNFEDSSCEVGVTTSNSDSLCLAKWGSIPRF